MPSGSKTERTTGARPPELLERDAELGRLTELFDIADAGSGQVVLLTGEAGIGKTSLVRHYVDSASDGKVLWGGCDDLLTPRPLGPIHDMARGALPDGIRRR